MGDSVTGDSTAQRRRRPSTALIVAAVVAALVLLGGGGLLLREHGAQGPEATVREFLDAVVAGEYARAATIAPPTDGDSAVLLTDGAGDAVDGGISDYTIDDVSTSSWTSTVTVTLRHGAGTDTLDLPLQESEEAGPGWALDYPYARHRADWMTGYAVEGGDPVPEGATVAALPGTYHLASATPNPAVAEEPGLLRAGADESMLEAVAPRRTLTEESLAAVQTQVEEQLRRCEGDQESRGEDETCPFREGRGRETWSLEEVPVVTAVAIDATSFRVQEDEPGRALIVPLPGTGGSEREEEIAVSGTVGLGPEGISSIAVELG